VRRIERARHGWVRGLSGRKERYIAALLRRRSAHPWSVRFSVLGSQPSACRRSRPPPSEGVGFVLALGAELTKVNPARCIALRWLANGSESRNRVYDAIPTMKRVANSNNQRSHDRVLPVGLLLPWTEVPIDKYIT
jgi:hypothetical protein